MPSPRQSTSPDRALAILQGGAGAPKAGQRSAGRRAPTGKLVTRKPTGQPSWPITLLASTEKCGKSFSAAQASASPAIGRTFYIELGEGDADQYGALPGVRYEIVEHDGTYDSILDAVILATMEPVEDPAKPNMIVLDSGTILWDLVSDEQQIIANLRRGPNANGQATITADQWMVAKKRWLAVLDALRAHRGPVIITARLELVSVFGDNGKPSENSPKVWKVRAEKNLPFEVDVIVQAEAPREWVVKGLRSVKMPMPKGGNLPLSDFTMHNLWDRLGVIGTPPQSRSYVPLVPEAGAPSETDMKTQAWVAMVAEAVTDERLRELYKEANAAGELNDVIVQAVSARHQHLAVLAAQRVTHDGNGGTREKTQAEIDAELDAAYEADIAAGGAP